MSDALQAEFDTVAEWTADAALSLGPEHYLPAGFRGSGGPRTIGALLEHLDVRPAHRLLDVGAGVGGPAAYARKRHGVQPVLVDPEAGACRAARRLFGLPTVRADAATLPFADASFDVVWSLGVLCTTVDHRSALRELRRVLAPGGRLGLLVYVATGEVPETPDGNNFPSPHGLHDDLDSVGFSVAHAQPMVPPSEESPSWQEKVSAVRSRIAERYASHEAWQTAQRQTDRMSSLLTDGTVTGQLFILDVG